MNYKHFFFSLLSLLFLSCEHINPYHESVERYFESWEGVWEIDQISYLDKAIDIPFTTNKPRITFFSCSEVTQRAGGMCQLSLSDQEGKQNSFFVIGEFTDEENALGEMRIAFSPDTETTSDFDNSLLIMGEFTCQQLETEKARMEGGRIPNFASGEPLISENIRINLTKR